MADASLANMDLRYIESRILYSYLCFTIVNLLLMAFSFREMCKFLYNKYIRIVSVLIIVCTALYMYHQVQDYTKTYKEFDGEVSPPTIEYL